MLKFLIPQIELKDLKWMIASSVLCALIAGLYGIGHDQWTYSLSQEYFTKAKFHQFQFADVGFPDRIFLIQIGFLATWWAGLIFGWFLARQFIPNQTRRRATRQIGMGIATIFISCVFSSALGWAYGAYRGPDADYSRWAYVLARYDVDDAFSFVRVAYIHNAGYLGAGIGFVWAMLSIRPAPVTP